MNDCAHQALWKPATLWQRLCCKWAQWQHINLDDESGEWMQTALSASRRQTKYTKSKYAGSKHVTPPSSPVYNTHACDNNNKKVSFRRRLSYFDEEGNMPSPTSARKKQLREKRTSEDWAQVVDNIDEVSVDMLKSLDDSCDHDEMLGEK